MKIIDFSSARLCSSSVGVRSKISSPSSIVAFYDILEVHQSCDVGGTAHRSLG